MTVTAIGRDAKAGHIPPTRAELRILVGMNCLPLTIAEAIAVFGPNTEAFDSGRFEALFLCLNYCLSGVLYATFDTWVSCPPTARQRLTSWR